MPAGFRSLTRLLSGGRAPTSIVAVRRDGSHDWEAFSAHVAALAAAVRRVGRGRWLLFSDDGYAFAVGLFALAHAGARAVLAPNKQPGTLRRIASDAQGAIVDRGITVTAPARFVTLHPLEQPAAAPRAWAPLDPDAPWAEFFTSGTTGAGVCVLKALRHLDDEVETLEKVFGARLADDTHVFATVSQQHIYGLLFRVLWPLASGRPFCAETLLRPEELFPRMRAEGNGALVTTPVHLKRLCGLEGLRTLRPACRVVFSSGGPLDATSARAIEEVLGAPPCEVFGSTETGGVAWRTQQQPNDAWTPFPRVRISRDEAEGCLVVRSRIVSVGREEANGERSFIMGDRVECVSDGRFLLHGRADRIAKIGAKRLSLPEMELRLRQHAWIAEVALLVLEQAAEARVHAVAVLTQEGRAALEREGRRRVNLQLGAYLESEWDRVLLPRIWRYVDALPYDTQGKTSVGALRALFEEGVAARPALLGEAREEHAVELRLAVPADLIFLPGHYEGFPMVAGVIQLHWVVEAANDWLGAAPCIRAVETLKFREVLRPAQRFRMRLELSPDRQRLGFRLWEGDQEFSVGRCLIGEPVRRPE